MHFSGRQVTADCTAVHRDALRKDACLELPTKRLASGSRAGRQTALIDHSYLQCRSARGDS